MQRRELRCNLYMAWLTSWFFLSQSSSHLPSNQNRLPVFPPEPWSFTSEQIFISWCLVSLMIYSSWLCYHGNTVFSSELNSQHILFPWGHHELQLTFLWITPLYKPPNIHVTLLLQSEKLIWKNVLVFEFPRVALLNTNNYLCIWFKCSDHTLNLQLNVYQWVPAHPLPFYPRSGGKH